jgi:putative ABC transport system substrate-binding protein
MALGASALAPAFVSFAQQPGKVWRIGFFYFGSRQSASDTGRYSAFIQGMRDLGYIEGKNLVIEARFGDGKVEGLPLLAAQLVQSKVDVIVATGTPTYRVLQQATATIPIVITVSSDPVRDGWAASMARPGGSFTGLSSSAADPGPKLLELLMAAVPKLSRVAVLLHPDNAGHPPQLKRIMSTAQKVGIQVVLAEAGSVQEIDREFAMMARERANAAIILNDTFFVDQLRQIAGQALKHRVPSINAIYEYAAAGGLMSYGPDLADNFRRAATFVDRILKGAKAGELPVEQPTRYYLVINRKAANALGLAIPQSLLVRADKVIE